jgi:hypothetical protein
MLKTLALAGLALAITALPAAAQMHTLSPEDVGGIFCISRIGNDMGPVQGLLTAGLTKVIDDAEVENVAWAAANPGDKPPLGDGIPWQAWPDYAPECTVGLVGPAQGEAWVDITYSFPASPEAGFTDQLHLVAVEMPNQSGTVWRIDNVVYAEGGDLRSALTGAFDR